MPAKLQQQQQQQQIVPVGTIAVNMADFDDLLLPIQAATVTTVAIGWAPCVYAHQEVFSNESPFAGCMAAVQGPS